MGAYLMGACFNRATLAMNDEGRLALLKHALTVKEIELAQVRAGL